MTPFDPAAERERLRQVCHRLTGDGQAAEDLAQEAVLIGLRRAERPGAAPRAWSPYLFGVARKLCAAWAARRNRDASRFAAPSGDDLLVAEPIGASFAPDPLESLLAGERERFVESAVAALRAPAREALIARYVTGISLAELAARWGVTPNAAAVRVHRARDGMRKLFETTLRSQAAAHGLLTDEAAAGWRETAIFCCRCGRERMQGRFVPGETFALRCPACAGQLDGMTSDAAPMDAGVVLSGVSGFRAGLNRVNHWWQGYLAAALATRAASCLRCAHAARVSIGTPPDPPGLGIWCDRCRAWTFYIHPTGLLYHSEATQAFWRRFPRMRNEPPHDVVCENRAAVLAAFSDRATAARVEMVFDRETLVCLRSDATP